jgi:hypothetical protein
MIRVSLMIMLGTLAAPAQVVALDGFHNDETAQPDHYQWEGTRPGGFSELGKLVAEAGGRTRTIRERINEDTLHGVDMLIIVDPDTPQESEHPRYIEAGEAAAIEKWVRAGGRLMLLGNDKGNAEFEHFNQLAKRFGITFREETYPKVAGKFSGREERVRSSPAEAPCIWSRSPPSKWRIHGMSCSPTRVRRSWLWRRRVRVRCSRSATPGFTTSTSIAMTTAK